ncbi:MAG: protein-L-isoaspartate O-methyltransferase [Methyloceanibacter sp.]|jgi:protein-L-isoaspartate(D-aspartate) O-methyltransferase
MTHFERARQTMVESQLRPSQVTDRRLLAAFATLPRERFVPPSKQPLAYMDAGLEVWPSIDGAPARFLLAPVILARLIQLAAVEANDAVLDIGCTTGYSTAVLARLARSVTGVEAEPELAAAASESLGELSITNASVVEGELALGAPTGAPYDVILLNGSVPEVPKTLLAQLKENGRLVAIVAHDREGRARQGKACRFVTVKGEASGMPYFDANAKPLPGFSPAPCFIF